VVQVADWFGARRTGIQIKVVSDIHGAVEDVRREAASADVLLVCGDLVNLLDYRTLEGPVVDAYGHDAVRRFVQLRTAGRFDEAGAYLHATANGRQHDIRERIRAGIRRQYEELFAAFPDNTYLTHGNVDDPTLFADLIRPGVHYLDGEAVEVDGLRVGFIGGGLPRGSAPHLSERTPDDYATAVRGLPPVDILCTHMPPAVDDLCFDVRAGRPEPGSPALLDYVARHQPQAHYFGHVHQPRRSRLRVGRTQVVNVGYFRATRRMLVHDPDAHDGAVGPARQRLGGRRASSAPDRAAP
jgi:Icc-related predicted phosphoesterase